LQSIGYSLLAVQIAGLDAIGRRGQSFEFVTYVVFLAAILVAIAASLFDQIVLAAIVATLLEVNSVLSCDKLLLGVDFCIVVAATLRALVSHDI